MRPSGPQSENQRKRKRDINLDLTKELKKLKNMKVTVIPIVIVALETISKSFERGLEKLEIGGRIETIQITTLLRSPRILRRVRKT